jgi:hypothetical protein
MALGDSYATLDEFKQYYDDKALAAQGTKYDALITQILTAASRMIDRYCDRQFNQAATESVRYFKSDYTDIWNLNLDDFVQTSAFLITTDNSGTGVFDTVWASTDYELLPLNGLNEDTNEPWPVETIHAVGGNLFPITPYRRYGNVKVNALWGWPEVPAGVQQATMMLCAQYFKMKDAPMGVFGFSGFQSMIRVKDNPLVEPLVWEYEKHGILGGTGSGHSIAGLY